MSFLIRLIRIKESKKYTRGQSLDDFIIGCVWKVAGLAERHFKQQQRGGKQCQRECTLWSRLLSWILGNATFENDIQWYRMAHSSSFCSADNDILVPISCIIDLELRIRHPFSWSHCSQFRSQTALKADIWQQCSLTGIFAEQQYE